MITKCPYCGKEDDFDITTTQYADGDRTLQTCNECEKVYNVYIRITVDCDCTPCQCQGENHEWELTPTYPKAFSTMRCKHCGEERSLTDKEREEYKIPSTEKYFKELEELSKQGPF